MGIGGHIELGPPLLDPAQRHVFYRVIADRVQMQCIAHGAWTVAKGKVSIRRKTCTYSRLPDAQRFFGLSRASSNRRNVANSVGKPHPCNGAAWSRVSVVRINGTEAAFI